MAQQTLKLNVKSGEKDGRAYWDTCGVCFVHTNDQGDIGPVTFSCRPKCSFRLLSVRRRPGFSIPVLNADAADCRSH